MLIPLALRPSFGFGDRLGLATAGHMAAVRGTKFAPVFAQQSVRENERTRRTPQQVMDDAKRAIEAAGWHLPWRADADHLKTLEDLAQFGRGLRETLVRYETAYLEGLQAHFEKHLRLLQAPA